MFFSSLQLRTERFWYLCLLTLSLLALLQCRSTYAASELGSFAILDSAPIDEATIQITHATASSDITSAEMLQATKQWLQDGRLIRQRADGFGVDQNQVHAQTAFSETLSYTSSKKSGDIGKHEGTNAVDSRPHEFGAFPTALTPKVFGVGLSKTGTTALHNALQSLGLKCIHFDEKLAGALLHRWRSSSPDLSGRYDKVDCVTDLPTAWHLEALVSAYPNAKFIATHRDVSEWYSSIVKSLKSAYGDVGVPTMTGRIFERTLGTSNPHEGIWKKNYIKHYERVKELIPSQQLLWLESDDLQKPDFHPFAQVCRFLSIETHECKPADAAWPRVVSTEQMDKQESATAIEAQKEVDSEESRDGETQEGNPQIARPDFAYVTYLSGAGEKSGDAFRAQYFTAAMVWCRSVRTTYNDAEQELRNFDMVLLTWDSDLSQSQLAELKQCFDRIIVTPVLGHAPVGTPDTPYWSVTRSKLAVFGLKDYRRVIAMDADQVVVKNLDAYFFRWFYQANAKNIDPSTDIDRAIDAARVDAASGTTSTPRMLYAIPHRDFPVDTNFLSLQPSQQVMNDLLDLLATANFNFRGGWNDYGPVSTPDPSTRWAPRVSLDRAPQLHATPMVDSTQFIQAWSDGSSLWRRQCAWADVGLTVYYFYLLIPELGGFVHPEDAQQSFIHYVGSNKPWLHSSTSVRQSVLADTKSEVSEEQRLHAEQWADAMDYWQQLAANVEQDRKLDGEHDSRRQFSAAQFQAAISEDMRQSLRFHLDRTVSYAGMNVYPADPDFTIATTTYDISGGATQTVTIVENTCADAPNVYGSAPNWSCSQLGSTLIVSCNYGSIPAGSPLSPSTTSTITYTAPSSVPAGRQDICTLSSSQSWQVTSPLTFNFPAPVSVSLLQGTARMHAGELTSFAIGTNIPPSADTVIHLDCTSPITNTNVASIDFTIRSGASMSEVEPFTPPKSNSPYLLSCIMTVTSSSDSTYSGLSPTTATALVEGKYVLASSMYIYGTKLTAP